MSSRSGMPHRLLDIARLVHMPGDAEELGADVVGRPMPENQLRAAAQDGRRNRDRLPDVVDGRGAAIDAHARRERRLQARHALLALQDFEQRRLLAADIGAGTVMDDDIEVPAVRALFLPINSGLIRLIDARCSPSRSADELAPNVDVAV